MTSEEIELWGEMYAHGVTDESTDKKTAEILSACAKLQTAAEFYLKALNARGMTELREARDIIRAIKT